MNNAQFAFRISIKKKRNTTLSTDFAMQRRFKIKEYIYCIFWNLISFTKKTNKKGADYYIITKCGHVFHAQCLEDWLAVKRNVPHVDIQLHFNLIL